MQTEIPPDVKTLHILLTNLGLPNDVVRGYVRYFKANARTDADPYARITAIIDHVLLMEEEGKQQAPPQPQQQDLEQEIVDEVVEQVPLEWMGVPEPVIAAQKSATAAV